ncbi:MAG: tetratricopeptide repeat protein [Nitrospirota bacterium]
MLARKIVFFIMAIVLLAAPAFAQEATPSPSVSPSKATDISFINGEAYGKLSEVRSRLKAKDYEGARNSLRDLENFCLDLGITSFEPLSAAMLKQGKSLLDAEDTAGALLLINSAVRISPDYPPAYFARGWAYFAQDKMKFLITLDSFREGFVKSLGDFWWPFFYLGDKFASFLFTLAALFSLFGLCMAVRYSALFSHDIAEALKKKESEPYLTYIILPLFFLAVLGLLGYWWAASVCFLSLWVYFNKKEKALAVCFFALLVFMPEIIGNFSNFPQAGGNRLLWVMDEVNKGHLHSGAEEYLESVTSKEPRNEAAAMSLAELYKKSGRYDDAAEAYEKLSTASPENTLYRNNLGNVYFLAGRNSDAVREYQAAIQYGPEKPLPYFNLSQVYGENLMFPERERADLAARELDPALVSALRERAGTEPVRMVFDYPVPVETFWRIAFSNRHSGLADSLWEMTVKVLPLKGTRLAGISFIILALAVSALRKKGVTSHFCKKCGKVSCRKCQKPNYSKELCPECHQIFVKLEGVEARDRVRKLLEVREKNRKKTLFCRSVTLVVPGTGHFLTGHPSRGFLFMGAFIFFVKDIFFGQFLSVPYEFRLPFLQPDVLLMSILLLAFYLFSQFSLRKVI